MLDELTIQVRLPLFYVFSFQIPGWTCVPFMETVSFFPFLCLPQKALLVVLYKEQMRWPVQPRGGLSANFNKVPAGHKFPIRTPQDSGG